MARKREKTVDSRDVVPAATTSLSPRGGARHRTMKESILAKLEKAGGKGMTITELADELEVLKPRVQGWFSGTGKRTPEVEKIAPATWRLNPSSAV
jgi:hypothetical protein